MKVTFLLLFIFTAPVFLYIACNPCGCPPVTDKFYEITSLRVTPYGNQNVPVDEGVPVNVDTMNLSYILFTQCLAYQAPTGISLINSAFACNCADCGYKGLKNKLVSIVITSDSAYSSTLPANTSLNNVFKVQKWNYYNRWSNATLDTVAQKIKEGYYAGSSLILSAVQKPTASKTHRFKLKMEFENGKTTEVVTKPITWF